MTPETRRAWILYGSVTAGCIILGLAVTLVLMLLKHGGGSGGLAGCTDQTALNHTPGSTVDDGSCEYSSIDFISGSYGCMSSAAFNYNAGAVMSDDSCQYAAGCLDPTALNHNASAIVASATYPCIYDTDDLVEGGTYIWGCMDPTSDTYRSSANQDDGTCVYYGCTVSGYATYDGSANVFNGTCSGIVGCMTSGAVNFNASATTDDDSCVFCDSYDEDGSCVISGCTNSSAMYYNPYATVDDGSCIFQGCIDSNAYNYNPDTSATVSDGSSCIYKACTNPDADNAVLPASNIISDSSLCIFYGCTSSAAINYDSGANKDNSSCLFLGCTDSDAYDFDPDANYNPKTNPQCYKGCMDPISITFNPEAVVNNEEDCEYDTAGTWKCVVDWVDGSTLTTSDTYSSLTNACLASWNVMMVANANTTDGDQIAVSADEATGECHAFWVGSCPDADGDPTWTDVADGDIVEISVTCTHAEE